jgi:hypothetical protein
MVGCFSPFSMSRVKSERNQDACILCSSQDGVNAFL